MTPSEPWELASVPETRASHTQTLATYLCSSTLEIYRSFLTDVPTQRIGPFFKGQEIRILDSWRWDFSLEEGTDRLSRMVDVELPL